MLDTESLDKYWGPLNEEFSELRADDYTLAVAWKLHEGDRMTRIVFGPLTYTPDA